MFAHNEQCLPYPEAIQQRVQQQQQVRQQQHFHVVNITHVQPRPAPQDLMDIHNNKEAAATAAANPTIDIAKLLHDVVHLDKQQQQLLYMSKEMIHASLVGTGLPEQKVVVDDLEGDALPTANNGNDFGIDLESKNRFGTVLESKQIGRNSSKSFWNRRP